jgi:hypothetical protein
LVMDTLSDTLSKRADFRHKEFAESFNRIGAGLRELKK